MKHWWGFGLPAALAMGLSATLMGADADTAAFGARVTVESGAVEGVVADGVLSFKGIPFAAPPVGDLRWKAPQPAAKWGGTRKADAYGHDCMQLPFPSDAAPLGTPPDEDCLVLNVWRPAEGGSATLPVMVWIYGGGFVNGGSSPAVYDGSAFAKRGVVFVSFNYRLGRFGFFAHPALTMETPTGPLGNYGYLDQIAALRWVKKNIGAFGGDAGNVTVFGESAGGGSVFMVMTSPLAQGLFHKAIVESGGGRAGGFGPPKHLRQPGPKGESSGEAVGIAFAAKNGITGDDAAALAALRRLPADTVVSGLNLMNMGQQQDTYPGPMIDGAIVVETAEAAFRAGRQARVPLVIGANDAEMAFFPMPPDRVDALLAPFGAERDGVIAAYGGKDAVGRLLFSDTMMVEPARMMARLHSATGQPTWQYRFSYVATSLRGKVAGALHATEIPFVFSTVRAKYEAQATPEDIAIGDAANAYWAAFARTGAPAVAGQPEWPPYTAAKDTIMDFASGGPAARPDPWKARLDFIEKAATAAAGTK
jgi:para-nitrobenzyl esterase